MDVSQVRQPPVIRFGRVEAAVARPGLSLVIIASCMFYPSISSAAKVLEYLFDDPSATRAIDTSGNNLHGTFMGSSIHIAASMPGHGNGIALNGIDDFINVGDHSILDFSNSYTLMGWINYRTTDEFKAELMEKGGAYWLNVRLNKRDGSSDTRQGRAGGFFDPCSGLQQDYHFKTDSPTPIPENTWTHLASTYNGSQLKLFVNGRLVNQLSVQRSVCVNDNPLAIGAKYVPAKDDNKNFVNGILDDVRVFDTALSAFGIQTLMGPGPGSAGALQFSAAAFSVGEGGGNATVTVTRAGGSNGQVSVAYTTGGGSATEGADYAFSQGSLTWSDGDAATKTISVPVIDDGDPEGDEIVNLTLSNPDGAVLGAADTAVLTITDNDQIDGQVMCNGRIATIVGSPAGETINGTSGQDVIHGLGGDDVIYGRGGDDIICGGWGKDDLRGNAGSDQLFGEGGSDRLNGGSGQDLCDGGPNLNDTATACEQVIAVP